MLVVTTILVLNKILKADRPHTDYPHTPTDYRHTDKYLKLVMTLLLLFAAIGKAEPLISTTARQKFDLDS